MQFQVPQFIETEDKIFYGVLSIRQFIYVAVAGAFSFFLYFTVQPWLFAVLSIFFLGIAGAFAFIQVGGRSLLHIAVSAFNFYWKPHTFVWQSEQPTAAQGFRGPEKETAGISFENIVSGMALRSVWSSLQTGSSGKVSGNQFFGKIQERYEVFRRASGEKQAARRIDYR